MTKKPLVIFGSENLAQLAHFYFSRDSEYEVVAFTVDGAYLKETTLLGLPVVPFEDISTCYPAEEYYLFIALSYSKLNTLRKEKYLVAKSLQYRLANYISSRSNILNEGLIGDNCFILEDNTIQPFVIIGNNVTLWSGNHIGHHSVIQDHCFIASHVVISGGVEIGEQCFIGVNATLRDHIKVGQRCIIGAGALLLSNAEPDGLYAEIATERSKVPTIRLQKI
jgi:sugar O-acyltransferase (sialic acid O-acetyltransferase NeuD family)